MTARFLRHLCFTTLLAGAAALPAAATVVSLVPAGIDVRVITFSDYNSINSASALAPDLDVGSAEVGEQVLLNSNNAVTERILGQVAQDFGANGSWPGGGAFAGLNALSGYLSFTFSRGLNFVGGWFNYTPGGDSSTTLQALDINGDTIEGSELSFSGSNGQFAGFTSATAEIYGLQMLGNFVAVDNLTFGSTPTDTGVPEPGLVLLVLTGLGLLAALRQRHMKALYSRLR